VDLFNSIALYCFSIIAAIFVLYDCLLFYLLAKVYRQQEVVIARLPYQEAKKIPDSELPVVTILLPLYREKIILLHLIQSVAKIDYPNDKLDIRFLVEHDDKETLEAIKDFVIRNKIIQVIESNNNWIYTIKAWSQILINIDYVTEGLRTKPNALNVGLRHARGKILCVYDAEDRPDEKQVRTVIAYMLKHPEVACVQARLVYYNDNQSIITKFFAIEYIQHFLVSLPTYFSLSNIILLGGSSNFFRIESLKSLGGWDPANVTEDADLGIRMARKNYDVVPLDVMTYEEAPPKVYPWLKQRIRWSKGYLYTLASHFRHPLKILKEIGLRSFLLTFHQLFFPIISALSLPGWILFAFYWLNWFGMPLEPVSKWIMTIFNSSPPLFYSSLLTLGFGLIYSILMSLGGLFRQGDDYALSKVKYFPLLPMYLVLQSVSSIIAIVELIVRPHLWHKTPHGFFIQNKELYQRETANVAKAQ
jgi:cellulose synthase/poly-beta-1,6-N-acetylglucosamine synthase-like glycosyltransferase